VYTGGGPARRELATLITNARNAAPTTTGRRMTQAALGRLIGCSQGTIQKIEAASVRIDQSTVELIIHHLGVDPDTADTMRGLAVRNAVGEPWSRERALVPRFARRYFESEQDAIEILSWHEMRIPGPLQSEHFMLNEFEVAGQFDPAPYIRNRARRRELFRKPGLLRYACLLAEESLHRAAMSFGPIVVCDEIDYLLDVNDLAEHLDLADDRTSVRLLPATTALIDPPGDFSILRLPDPKDSFVYIEHAAGSHYVSTPEGQEKAMTTWLRLDRIALDRDGTCRFLRKLRDEFASG
jgi:transcriptional regulator with XRE-family HTH domain